MGMYRQAPVHGRLMTHRPPGRGRGPASPTGRAVHGTGRSGLVVGTVAGFAGVLFVFAVAAAATVYALQDHGADPVVTAPMTVAAPAPSPLPLQLTAGLDRTRARLLVTGPGGVRVWRAPAAAGREVCHVMAGRLRGTDISRVDCATPRQRRLDGLTLAGTRLPAGIYAGYAVLAGDVRRVTLEDRDLEITGGVVLVRARPGERWLVAHAPTRVIRVDLSRRTQDDD